MSSPIRGLFSCTAWCPAWEGSAIGLEYLCWSTDAQTDRLTDRRTVANARRDAEEEQKELLDNHSQSVNDVFYVDK